MSFVKKSYNTINVNLSMNWIDIFLTSETFLDDGDEKITMETVITSPDYPSPYPRGTSWLYISHYPVHLTPVANTYPTDIVWMRTLRSRQVTPSSGSLPQSARRYISLSRPSKCTIMRIAISTSLASMMAPTRTGPLCENIWAICVVLLGSYMLTFPQNALIAL